MSVVRYKSIGSESGAYVFAPADKAIPLKLKPIEAYATEGKFNYNLIVAYKSVYKSTCHSISQISIDKEGISSRVIKMKIK